MQGQIAQEQKDSPFFLTNFRQTVDSHEVKKKTLQNSSVHIENWFQQNAKFLQHKRQHTLKNRKRIKEIQLQYAKKQEHLQKSLQKKLQNSEQIRSRSVTKIQQNLKKISEKKNKLILKSKVQHEQELKKYLEKRKSFQPSQDYSLNSKYSRKSQTSSIERRVDFQLQKINKNEKQIQQKLTEINQKQNHAKQISNQYKKQTTLRARSHNSIEVYDVKHRALQLKQKQLRKKSHSVITRMDQLNMVRHHRQKHIQDQQNKRHKTYNEKIKKIQNNLAQIQEETLTKYGQLTQKLEKQTRQKEPRNPRTTIRSKKIIENLQAIQSQQAARVDRIVEKQRETNYRTKLFKEKRDYLYKTIRQSSY